MDAAEAVAARIRRLRVARVWGEVTAIRAGLVIVGGLGRRASIGDRVSLGDGALFGEIVAVMLRLWRDLQRCGFWRFVGLMPA